MKICLHVSCKNGLKQGDVLLPLLFNFALECTIRKADQEGFKLIGTHQLVFYNDFNVLQRKTQKRQYFSAMRLV